MTYNSNTKKPVSVINDDRNSNIGNTSISHIPETMPNNNIGFDFVKPTNFTELYGDKPNNLVVLTESVQRLEYFLSYLSDKIKSNTLKISQEEVESQDISQTTASRSDLSIDEINLRRFKEYML